MELKPYQRSALKTLGDFLSHARETDAAAAFSWALDQPPLEGQPALRARLGRYDRPYRAPASLADVPFCCVRVPTGGGKTLLAAHAVEVVRDAGWGDYPLVLWLVTSDAIRTQTAEALNNPRHSYRRALDEAFGGRVRVFDIADFTQLRPHDLAGSACIVVGTVQTLRVNDTNLRKVYAHHEELEPHFSRLTAAQLAGFPGLETRPDGGVKFSFANLLHLHRPALIIDEAHNVVTGLSEEMRRRINPSCVIEFTATPRERSNILFNAGAAELKQEQMIKLPVVLQAHSHWQGAVAGAVAERSRLAADAASEREYIRPIALYQAEPKNREVTVEVLRRHLIDDLHVAEAAIAVATGIERGLEAVDLSAPGCPIEHVITVEALREGWDCPFAYVFCSVASVRSATAVEQLLGRVLRMPYARRRRAPALNRAYAHVSEADTFAAAQALKDRLVDLGFEDGEAEEAIEPATLPFEGEGLGAPTPPAPELDVIDTPEVRAVLAEAGVVAVPAREGVLTLSASALARPGLVDRVLAASPAGAAAEALRRSIDALPLAPAAKGEVMRVPRLMTQVQGELVLADLDLLMEYVDWRLSDETPETPGLADALTETVQRFEIDLQGASLRLVFLDHTADLFTGAVEGWTPERLVVLLDPLTRDAALSQPDLIGWLTAVVRRLTEHHGLSVGQLMRMRHALAGRLRRRIAELKAGRRAAAAQQWLLDPGAPVSTLASESFVFQHGMYDDQPVYRGPFGFTRHFLSRVPTFDGRPDGEEARCALVLDGLKGVRWWVRNVARHPGSFWLQTSRDRTYPDFVAQLADGRLLVVEYKGAQGWTDAQEDRAIGAAWERAGGGLYLMVRDRDDQGRDTLGQLRAKLGGPA